MTLVIGIAFLPVCPDFESSLKSKLRFEFFLCCFQPVIFGQTIIKFEVKKARSLSNSLFFLFFLTQQFTIIYRFPERKEISQCFMSLILLGLCGS